MCEFGWEACQFTTAIIQCEAGEQGWPLCLGAVVLHCQVCEGVWQCCHIVECPNSEVCECRWECYFGVDVVGVYECEVGECWRQLIRVGCALDVCDVQPMLATYAEGLCV